MPAGRPPKPDALKAAQGNPGRRPPVDETQAAAPGDTVSRVLGPAPDMLTKQGGAIWDELAQDLAGMNFVRPTDRQAFARYCDALVTFWQVTRTLRRQKLTYETKSPFTTIKRVNPLFSVQTRLELRLQAHEASFGLTPMARQNLLVRLANTLPADLFDRDGDDSKAEAEEPEDPTGLLNNPAVLH